jgi:hypothetical protein
VAGHRSVKPAGSIDPTLDPEKRHMVDIDIDIWRDGRNANGSIELQCLLKHYPFTEIPPSYNSEKLRLMLQENFEPNHNGQKTYFISFTLGYVFFQDKGDADLCRALFYVY